MSSSIFVARHSLLGDELSSVVYAEACFSSWQLAREWLRQFEEKDDRDSGFRNSITEHKLDRPSWKHREWQYLLDGSFHSVRNRKVGFKNDAVPCAAYKAGDLVVVPSNTTNPRSPFLRSRVAVVVGESEPLHENKEAAGESVQREYIVYYVANHGGPKHRHLPEMLLTPLADAENPPDTEPFVLLYSKVLRNQTSQRVRSIVQKAIDEDFQVASPSLWTEVSL